MISLSLSLLFILLCTQHIHAYKYIGCYLDEPLASNRDLSGALYLEESMTVGECERRCVQSSLSSSFTHFGVQFGMECWCGNSYGRHGSVDESRCSSRCGGNSNEICGGSSVNSVYEITQTYPRKSKYTHSSGRPLLGLVMIVKDEAHTLPQTFQAIKPYIDVYHILDTGSTDGTQQAIKDTLGADKGVVYEEPFVDYGTSRNRALELAERASASSLSPIFSLMLSADETVYNAAALREFCEEHGEREGDDEEAYAVQMDVGWKFDSLRLSRTDKSWRYKGAVHEYLASPDGRYHRNLRVPSTFIKFRVTDPERRSQREYLILSILLREKEKNPTDTRTSFYLARTYNVIGNHSEALTEFERRVSLGGWAEEVYESLYAIAWQRESLGQSWGEVHQAFLNAYEYANDRAEPLYAIASHYYKKRDLNTAYIYAKHAATIPYPKNAVLWVQAPVYNWQCHFIVGMTAYKLQRYIEGAKALMIVRKFKTDEVVVQQLNKYKEYISDQDWNTLEAEAGTKQPASVGAAVDSSTVEKGDEMKNVDVSTKHKRLLSETQEITIVYILVIVVVFLLIVLGVVVCSMRQSKVVKGADGQASDKWV